MTTQTEELKLARQLLWRYRHETPIGRQPHMICQEVDEAFERIDEALAQPEQEPVAFLTNRRQRLNVEFNATGLTLMPKSVDWKIPLYTTPPQRKPLTDEQMDAVTQAWAGHSLVSKERLIMCREYARAIEAAHGIKGDA